MLCCRTVKLRRQDRFAQETSGQVEVLKTSCVSKHKCTTTAEFRVALDSGQARMAVSNGPSAATADDVGGRGEGEGLHSDALLWLGLPDLQKSGESSNPAGTSFDEVLPDADCALGLQGDQMNLVLQMEALGLPTAFTASSKFAERRAKRKSSKASLLFYAERRVLSASAEPQKGCTQVSSTGRKSNRNEGDGEEESKLDLPGASGSGEDALLEIGSWEEYSWESPAEESEQSPDYISGRIVWKHVKLVDRYHQVSGTKTLEVDDGQLLTAVEWEAEAGKETEWHTEAKDWGQVGGPGLVTTFEPPAETQDERAGSRIMICDDEESELQQAEDRRVWADTDTAAGGTALGFVPPYVQRCWDSDYSCYYYYDERTGESSWEAPKGALNSDFPAVEGVEGPELDRHVWATELEDKDADHHQLSGAAAEGGHVQGQQGPVGSLEELPWTQDSESVIVEVCGTLSLLTSVEDMPPQRNMRKTKYWRHRYCLFSKFDEGVQLDEEGLYSVTPEAIARHQAERCRPGVVLDGFTGVGGNAIQFALGGHSVLAVDIDPQKIEFARQNARVYGVEDLIEFIVGDFFEIAPTLKADTVFLSPPWGGPDYAKEVEYDLDRLQPKDGFSLLKAAKAVASNIMMYLPRNVKRRQLQELSLASRTHCEVEKAYLNGHLKAITVYLGDFGPP